MQNGEIFHFMNSSNNVRNVKKIVAVIAIISTILTTIGLQVFADTPSDYDVISKIEVKTALDYANFQSGKDIDNVVATYASFIQQYPTSQYDDDAALLEGIVQSYASKDTANVALVNEYFKTVEDKYPDAHLDPRTIETIKCGYGIYTKTMEDISTTTTSGALAEYLRANTYNNINKYPNTTDYQKAIDIYNDMIAKFPSSSLDAMAQYEIAQSYEQLYDTQNAITAYEKTIENYPSETTIVYLSYNRIGTLLSENPTTDNIAKMDTYAEKFASEFSATDYLTECGFSGGNGELYPIFNLNINIEINNEAMSATQEQMVKQAFAEWNDAIGDPFTFNFTDKVFSQNGLNLSSAATTPTIYVNGTDMTGGIGGQTFGVGSDGKTIQASIVLDVSSPDAEFYHEALHEIGHSFGLQHSWNRNDVMYFGGDYSGNTHLTQRDINTLQKYVDLIRTNSAKVYADAVSWNASNSTISEIDASLLSDAEKIRLTTLVNQTISDHTAYNQSENIYDKALQTNSITDIQAALNASLDSARFFNTHNYQLKAWEAEIESADSTPSSTVDSTSSEPSNSTPASSAISASTSSASSSNHATSSAQAPSSQSTSISSDDSSVPASSSSVSTSASLNSSGSSTSTPSSSSSNAPSTPVSSSSCVSSTPASSPSSSSAGKSSSSSVSVPSNTSSVSSSTPSAPVSSKGSVSSSTGSIPSNTSSSTSTISSSESKNSSSASITSMESTSSYPSGTPTSSNVSNTNNQQKSVVISSSGVTSISSSNVVVNESSSTCAESYTTQNPTENASGTNPQSDSFGKTDSSRTSSDQTRTSNARTNNNILTNIINGIKCLFGFAPIKAYADTNHSNGSFVNDASFIHAIVPSVVKIETTVVHGIQYAASAIQKAVSGFAGFIYSLFHH